MSARGGSRKDIQIAKQLSRINSLEAELAILQDRETLYLEADWKARAEAAEARLLIAMKERNTAKARLAEAVDALSAMYRAHHRYEGGDPLDCEACISESDNPAGRDSGSSLSGVGDRDHGGETDLGPPSAAANPGWVHGNRKCGT